MDIKEIAKTSQPDRLIGIAAILSSLPRPFVWWITVVVSGLVVFGLFLFSPFIIQIGKISFIVVGILFVLKIFHDLFYGVVTKRLQTLELFEKTRRLHLANEKLIIQLEMHRRLPMITEIGMRQGSGFEYGGLKLLPGVSTPVVTEQGVTLPSSLRYEDIRHQIPDGHNLVGVGESGIITKEDRKIGACVWIVGLSGTGKTTTTAVRVEERAACGHRFLGVDPHWFKDDSLTNALVGYAEMFDYPMARDTHETMEVLRVFWKEFTDRKAGRVAKPWQKVTLVVDEVNALADPHGDDEEKVLDLLKSIVRVCGQEARNFLMGGIFISQQATGLYWIGNVALLIIVHKLLKENQQRLATQVDDKTFLAEMRLWPVGRTYVYGAGLEAGEGCLTVQQPQFSPSVDGEWKWIEHAPDETDEEIIIDAVSALEASQVKPTVDVVTEYVEVFSRAKVGRLMKVLKEEGKL